MNNTNQAVDSQWRLVPVILTDNEMAEVLYTINRKTHGSFPNIEAWMIEVIHQTIIFETMGRRNKMLVDREVDNNNYG